MPADPRILGLANRWYAKAIETAQDHELENSGHGYAQTDFAIGDPISKP